MQCLALKEKQDNVQKEWLKGRKNMKWLLKSGRSPLAFILSLPHETSSFQFEHTSYRYLNRSGLWPGSLSRSITKEGIQHPTVWESKYKDCTQQTASWVLGGYLRCPWRFVLDLLPGHALGAEAKGHQSPWAAQSAVLYRSIHKSWTKRRDSQFTA